MKKNILIFFLLFLFVKVNAQFQGVVLDKQTNEPLVFVEIYFPDLKTGTTTDENGIFTVAHYTQSKIHLIINYIGYKTIDEMIDIKATPKKTFYLEAAHFNIEEVVVSTSTSKLQHDAVVSVVHQKLASLSKMPVASLAESISNIAGVSQNTTGSGIGKPIIRGLSGNRIVIYAQGIRIENQQWGDEHGLGLGEIGIESVEVIKGPASLLYGSDALGGVLFFVDERYAKHNTYEIGAQSKYVSNSLGYLNNATFKIHRGKFKFNLFGAYNTHADYKIPNGSYVINTRFNEKNIKAAFGFNANNWISNIRYSYLQNNFGISEGADYSNITSHKIELPFQTIDNHNFSIENKFTLKDDSKLNTVLGYTANYRREFEDDSQSQALGLHLNTFTYNLKWQSSTIKDIFDFVIGSQGMHQTNKNNGEEILIPDAKTNDIGVYGLANFKINEFKFQTGIRFDKRKIDTKTTQNITAFIAEYNGVTFSAGTVYKTDKIKFRANISSGFRAPNTSELLSDGVHEGTSRYEKGNRNLNNEQATQFDFSFDYQTEHLKFSINPFYNYIKNYIYLAPTNTLIAGVPVYDYLQKDAFLYGGEMGVHYHPHQLHWLHLSSDFSTVFAEDTNSNALPLIPQSKLNTSINAEFDSDKKISIHKIYLQHIYKFRQARIGLFETETNGYHLVNLGLNLLIKTKGNPIQVDTGVKNLLNKTYIDHLSRFKTASIPNQGINYYISLKMNLH